MQKLVPPINDFKPTAGYKNKQYKSSFGHTHFGIDCVSATGNRKLYASGSGTVIAAGLDGMNGRTKGAGSGCGYCLIILYKSCYNHATGAVADYVGTYMHMASMPAVKEGDRVIKGTYLGDYGNTGQYTTGAHLHIQFSTDTLRPLNCTGMAARGHNLLKGGVGDFTVNPCDLFHIGAGQRVYTKKSSYYNKEEFDNLPKVTAVKKVLAGTKTVDIRRQHTLF